MGRYWIYYGFLDSPVRGARLRALCSSINKDTYSFLLGKNGICIDNRLKRVNKVASLGVVLWKARANLNSPFYPLCLPWHKGLCSLIIAQHRKVWHEEEMKDSFPNSLPEFYKRRSYITDCTWHRKALKTTNRCYQLMFFSTYIGCLHCLRLLSTCCLFSMNDYHNKNMHRYMILGQRNGKNT